MAKISISLLDDPYFVGFLRRCMAGSVILFVVVSFIHSFLHKYCHNISVVKVNN